MGPHNIDVISVIFGLLLGDGYAAKHGDTIKIVIKQSIIHKGYLFFLYDFFFTRGYCSNVLPRLYKRTIKGRDKIYQGYEFNLFGFSSFYWIYELFYNNGVKRIPYNIGTYLTPQALAILIQDDGGWTGYGVRIATNSFLKEDVKLLISVLETKFGLKCTLQKIGLKDKYSIYIVKESIPQLRLLVLPYFHESMKYKLGL